MKKLIFIFSLICLPAFSQVKQYAPASQAEVNAGTIASKFVSPATLAGFTGTNVPAGTLTNIARSVVTNDSTLLATSTSPGTVASNDWVRMQLWGGQSKKFKVPPIMFMDSGQWAAGETNSGMRSLYDMISLAHTNGWYDAFAAAGARPWIFFDHTYLSNNFVFPPLWDPTYMPDGPQAVIAHCHTNGFNVILWNENWAKHTDPGNAVIKDDYRWMQYALTNWGMDGFWWDCYSFQANNGLRAVAQLGIPFWLEGSEEYPAGGQLYPVEEQRQLFSSVRMNSVLGDILSWSNYLWKEDTLITNGWYGGIEPGSYLTLDVVQAIALTDAEVETTTIYTAMRPGPLHLPRDFGLPCMQICTNSEYLSILEDPSVRPGFRPLHTDTNDVVLRPIRINSGQSWYAMAVLNRTTNAATFSFAFTNLGIVSTKDNLGWSVFDVKSKTWLSNDVASTSVSLTNHQTKLFEIVAGRAVTTNYFQPFFYGPTLPAAIISNGVTVFANLAWDPDVTNFIARAQLTNYIVQCYAAQFLFTRLKDVGTWNKLDALYPVLPTAPYLNAISANYPLWSVGTVTTNNQGIAGNASNSFFTNALRLDLATYFQQNSASFGIYIGNQSPFIGAFMGAYGGSVSKIGRTSNSQDIDLNDLSSVGLGGLSDWSGLNVASRTGPSTILVALRGTISSGSTTSSAVTPNYCYFGAVNGGGTAGQFSDALIQGAWIGGSVSANEISRLTPIWDEYERILGRTSF